MCCFAVFEGSSGADIHVSSINSGSPASHLAHLRHGMLLKRVQDIDVTELEYDDAIERITTSTRPLKLHFYDRKYRNLKHRLPTGGFLLAHVALPYEWFSACSRGDVAYSYGILL